MQNIKLVLHYIIKIVRSYSLSRKGACVKMLSTIFYLYSFIT